MKLKKTDIRFLLFFLCLVVSINVNAVPIDAVQDTRQPDTLCKDGLMAVGECPDGYKLPPEQGPTVAFTDLISGPDTGLGDGLGSGVIVTAWGFNLGSTQGTSTIEYCDSLSVCRAGNVYYWKNADGTLPSGPANLYESHGMQEIAFSIPDSALGIGRIKITVDGKVAVKHDTTTENPQGDISFLVRAGNIYHVKSTGNDSTGDGSFANPWLTVDRVDNSSNGVGAGSTIYIHGVITGDENTDMAIYNNNPNASSTLDAQFSYVAYPNTRPESIGARTFNNWLADGEAVYGLVMSKFSLYAAEMDTDENDLPVNRKYLGSGAIKGSANGRAVGNFITDEHPSDTTGACPDAQGAAITTGHQGRDQVSNFKVFGNHIKDYGCAGTNRQHHTTYFTIRSADANAQVVAPEVGYNYLQDNMASGGLHYFDENLSGVLCGDFTTTFKLHNNVVVNQVGVGIANYAKCPTTTTFEYYNNLVINSGVYPPTNALLAPTKRLSLFGAVHIGQSEEASTATLNFNNNTFINWDVDNQGADTVGCIDYGSNTGTLTINWNSNICTTDQNQPFLFSNYQGTELEDRISGGGNVWYTSASEKTNAVAPAWDATKITTDPLLTITGSKVSVGEGSPLIEASQTSFNYDLYGIVRGQDSNTGAVQ